MRLAAQYPYANAYLAPQEAAAVAGRFDGWYAALLLFMLVFGPSTAPSESLPPIRSADALVLVLLLSRWTKSSQLHGGFLFTRRIRVFSLPILWITFLLTVATMLQIAFGDYKFFIKDFFTPIALTRMVLIAAIMASFDFDERNTQQFCKGFLLIALLNVALAMVQRYYPSVLAGFIESYYNTPLRSLEIESKGTQTRVVGTLIEPNIFAGFLVMMAAGCLAIAIFSKRLMRLVALTAYFGLAVAVVVTTASRTGIIALTIMTAMELVLSMQGRARWSAMIIFMILLPVFLMVRNHAYSLPLNPRTQALIAGEEGAVSEGMYSRFAMWDRSWEEVQSSLFIGVGSRKMRYQTTDNGYVFMLLKCGIVGLTTYVVMILCMLLRGLRAFVSVGNRTHRMLIAFGMATVLTHAMFEVTGEFFWNITYGAIFSSLAGLYCGTTCLRPQEPDAVSVQEAIEVGYINRAQHVGR